MAAEVKTTRAGAARFAFTVIVCVALLEAPPVASPVGARSTTEADPRKKALEQRTLPLDEPADFASLRKKADALAAGQDAAFRLYQVDAELESSTLRITRADLRYFRPARREWEQLIVDVSTGGRIRMGGTQGRAFPGSIGGSRTIFGDAQPTPAPGKLIAPEDATRSLTRGVPTGPFGDPRRAASYLRDHSQWRVRVQLVHSAARYQTGNIALSPIKEHVPWIRRYIQPSMDDAFFKQTAPRNAWVWWTVIQHPDAPGQRYEYVYMDPASGRATSHCAEPSASGAPAVVACAATRR